MSAVLPAFLFEAVFYLAALFEETRDWIGRFRPARLLAAGMWLSAIAPYLIFSWNAGTFQRNAFYLLAILTAVAAFWFAVLPRRWAFDFGFLVLAAIPLLRPVFPRIYRLPEAHVVHADYLGHLMWIRLCILALLVLRGWDPGGFSPWPKAQEWRVGALYYVLVVGPIVLLALGLHELRFEPIAIPWLMAATGIGVFFAFLWVVALSEELLFRGVIEKALLNAGHLPAVAVIVSALLFGSVHLWYHAFPNWRRAAVATLLGLACGSAYAQTGSVRAPMVTHALVVATWKMFFK
jgi:membrane protease YdiL (CAAX protease family)